MCTRLAFRSYGRFHWQKHICSSRHVTSKTSFFVQCVHGLMTTSPHPAVRCEAADLLAVLTQTDQTFKVNVCPDLCSRMNEQCASNYSADHRAIVLILCSTVKHFIISFYLFVFFFYSLGWIFCFCACLYAVACVQWLQDWTLRLKWCFFLRRKWNSAIPSWRTTKVSACRSKKLLWKDLTTSDEN